MEQQRNSAQRDQISTAEKFDDRHQRSSQPTGKARLTDRRQSAVIGGEIVNLKWKAPSNGIAGLL